MDFESFWIAIWGQIESTPYQLWDYLKDECFDHPYIAIIIPLIIVVLWRFQKGGRK
jgi:hypothetical protein